MNAVSPLGPEVRTLDEVLATRAAHSPDALAFTFGAESLSYGRLRSEAESLASGLAGLGVRRGDRVALLVPAGLDFIRAFFALQRLAAIPCAFDPGGVPATVIRRIARVRPALVLASGPAADGVTEMRAVKLDEVPRTMSALDTGPGEDDVAFLQPTSGTSGEPRAAVILHRNAIASLRTSRDLIGLGPRDVFVGWVPPWHDLGLLRFVLGPVYFGAPCHLVPPAIRTLPLWLRTASEVRATVMGAPDFAYRLATRLVDPDGLDLSSLRYATNGGEPVRQSTILSFEQRFGVPGVVRPGYGLAEATLGVTGLRPGEPLRVDSRGNVSCGRPLPGVEVRIDGDPGETGEILVRSPAVFKGYFEAEEETRETLRGGWLHTGDMGRLDADGHLYVLGRKRSLLKRGGAPLAPRELEEAAEHVPGVRVAAAVGLPPGPDAATEEIVLAVEADPAASSPQLASATAAAVEEVLGFAPDAVLILAPRTIPRTPNGKIRHATLLRAIVDGELERGGAVLFQLGRLSRDRRSPSPVSAGDARR
ncbi:MAG TPA: AMP-binding protein [Thermoanaerobaculia bacterium]|nr:AMP-binding protein [Thermoanaerobaculia bacterium]